MTDSVTEPENTPAPSGKSQSRRRWGLIVLGVVVGSIVALIGFAAAADPGPARYVGRGTCAQCHQNEHDEWLGSHHDLAMALPTDETVLGDFSGVDFEHLGLTARFYKDGDRFMVRTEGPDGKLHDYPVAYTFGYDPLQQYLIEFPGGRYQSLTIAWDTKQKQWYSLYPEQRHAPDDWLHWTQRGQNWNANCAECHSTDLRKNYDIETDTYQTAFAEINVSCEACHGPGSRHVAWASAGALDKLFADYNERTKGLVHSLNDPGRAWGLDDEGKPKLMHTSGVGPDMQIDACARCHSLRSPLTPVNDVGDAFLDHWAPTLLRDGLYHADGQIDSEVYVYGSFHQSKMYQHGVRCTDCHNPHTLKLVAPGNTLCIRCHNPTQYDVPAHHHHEQGSTGASCVECHMPTKNYMVVDPRRDHSIRIPRPDLTPITGAPNACNQCHTDKDTQWSIDAVKKWYPDTWPEDPRWGPALAAGWQGDPRVGPTLTQLFEDTKRPPYIRASAAQAAQGYLDADALNTAVKQLADDSALVRREAAVLLVAAPPEQRVQALSPLLSDPVRAVRVAAARSLAVGGASKNLDDAAKQKLQGVLFEQEAGLKAHADNRGGRAALGGFYEDLGRTSDAIAQYRKAVEFDRRDIDVSMALVRALINAEQDRQAAAELERILELPKPPETPAERWSRATGEIHYQLGLLLSGDEQRRSDGLRHLGQAAKRLPDVPRVRYNFALALSAARLPDQAEQQLLIAQQLEPANPDYLFALATINRDHGRIQKALHYAQQLLIQYPNLTQARQLFGQLQRQAQQRPAP